MGSCAHSCTTTALQCAACLYANASTRSPANLAPRPSPKNNILNKTICSRAIVYQPTIISLLFLVKSHTRLVKHVAVFCGSCKWKNIQLSPTFQHYFGDYQKFTSIGGNGSGRRFLDQRISLQQWHF